MTPIHPAFVHFPIALVPLSVAADVIAYATGSSALRATAWWCLVVGAAAAAVTVVAGFVDMERQAIEHDAHHRVHTHMKVGLAVFSVTSGLAVWRWLVEMRGGAVSLGYLAAGLGIVGLVVFQAWLGGELVFRHGVGVAQAGGRSTGDEKPAHARPMHG